MTCSALALATLLALGAAGETAGPPGPPMATEVLKTKRFTIVYTERARGAAHFLAERIEAVRDQIKDEVGRDWPSITEVRLGFGREEYEALAIPGGRPPPWAVALAYPDRNIVLVEAHSLVKGDGQVTLRHELVHVALGQLGRGWPHWYQEGLAMELTSERRFRMTQYATLAEAVAMDRIYRFDDLAESFPSHPEDVEIAYAQSAAFVEYLRQRHGAKPFGVLIDRMQAGDVFDTAFGVAFHSSRGVEERAFQSELKSRYPWWPLLLSGGSLVWGLTSVLLVVAALKQRRQIALLRREQTRIEHLEDLGQLLLDALESAANDDAEPSALPIESPIEHTWIVHSVRSFSSPTTARVPGATRQPGT